MTTYVLVHGGWHGGWCWDPVADQLRAKGHQVFAPSLTGLAERRHLIDLVTGPDIHVQDIVELIRWHKLTDIVLVGHSYGGLIITGVAAVLADKIAHLVYLDAFVPQRSGQSAVAMSNPERASEIAEAVKNNKHIEPSGFKRWVADPAQQAWLKTMTTPQPLGCFGRGVSRVVDVASLDLLRTYIWCRHHDPSPFVQFYERFRQDPHWQCLAMDCLHDAMLEQPNELTGILLEQCRPGPGRPCK
ncbi:MAG: alpha/beta fold hydrolase [Burkholderiaceae bacterium]